MSSEAPGAGALAARIGWCVTGGSVRPPDACGVVSAAERTPAHAPSAELESPRPRRLTHPPKPPEMSLGCYDYARAAVPRAISDCTIPDSNRPSDE